MQRTQGAATNSEGYFIIPALPVGYYRINIQHIAHQKRIIEDVSIHLGKTTTLGIQKLELKTLVIPSKILTTKLNGFK